MVQATFEFRIKQNLTLTPRLQQSVKLLQLSSIEFSQEIQQALASNPFLEEIDSSEECSPEAANASDDSLQNNPSDPLKNLEYNHIDQVSERDIQAEKITMNEHELFSSSDDHNHSENIPAYNEDYSSLAKTRINNDDFNSDVGEWAKDIPGLHQHLYNELRHYRLSKRDKILAYMIIDSIDEDGYLRQDLEELITEVNIDPPISSSEMITALNLVQQLEPAGIGARHLTECLKLQLDALPINILEIEIAHLIVEKYLPLLARRDYQSLERELNISSEKLQKACALVRRLDPKPGLRFGLIEHGYIVPDVIVKKIKNRWIVMTNPAVLPRARLHQAYADMFQNTKDSSHANLAQQLQEAKWMVRNIEQRFNTIERVANSIVAHQKTFFEYGDIAIKPMVLKQVADELDLHESTISRATGNKYMSTPRGTFEFKHFFSREISTETGGTCSAAAVRALIKEMIEKENCNKPLSDVKLTRMLADQGVIVARRTVTKYRCLMKVPPAELRKQN